MNSCNTIVAHACLLPCMSASVRPSPLWHGPGCARACPHVRCNAARMTCTTSSRVEDAARVAWGLHDPAAQAVGPALHSAMRCPRGAGTRNCAKLKGCTAGTPLSPGTINAVVTQQQRHYGGMTA